MPRGGGTHARGSELVACKLPQVPLIVYSPACCYSCAVVLLCRLLVCGSRPCMTDDSVKATLQHLLLLTGSRAGAQEHHDMDVCAEDILSGSSVWLKPAALPRLCVLARDELQLSASQPHLTKPRAAHAGVSANGTNLDRMRCTHICIAAAQMMHGLQFAQRKPPQPPCAVTDSPCSVIPCCMLCTSASIAASKRSQTFIC